MHVVNDRNIVTTRFRAEQSYKSRAEQQTPAHLLRGEEKTRKYSEEKKKLHGSSRMGERVSQLQSRQMERLVTARGPFVRKQTVSEPTVIGRPSSRARTAKKGYSSSPESPGGSFVPTRTYAPLCVSIKKHSLARHNIMCYNGERRTSLAESHTFTRASSATCGRFRVIRRGSLYATARRSR